MNNHNSGGGFLQGLLLGALIGGGAVFLLGTKKGKKLLKTLTEEGLEGIAGIEDLIEDEIEEYEEPKAPVRTVEKTVEGVVAAPDDSIASKTSDGAGVTGHARRLFKGVRKKS